MADSKCLKAYAQADPGDLIHCGLCHAILDKPKMMPCQHTFCLHCLSSWADSATEKNPEKYKVSCPTCKEEYALPAGGVPSLKTNFFLIKLKEMKTVKHQLESNYAQIPCTACDAASNSVSHCVECHDFLCQKCVDAHIRVRVTKDHQFVSLQEFCADNFNRPMFDLPEQEKCLKHKGEALLFFCEHCEVPICRNCTVIDHPSPDHKHVDLEDAAGRCTEELQKLVQACQNVPETFDPFIEEDEKTLANLKFAIVNAENEIVKTTEMAKSELLRKLHEVETKRTIDIENHKKTLQSLQMRLRSCLEVSQLVTQIGSDHDKTAMFSVLSNTMKQATKDNQSAIRKSLAMVQFKPNKDNIVKHLGILTTMQFEFQEKNFGQGQLNSARCIVVCTNTDEIAITEFDSKNPCIKVFGCNGKLKSDINTFNVGEIDITGQSVPWGLAVAEDGQYFVTDLNPYVKVFDAHGKFKHRFGTWNTSSGQWSYSEKSQLYGLVIDYMGRVFVGNHGPAYISIHNQDGSHVSSFSIRVTPYFIAVTPRDHVLISDHQQMDLAVHVYDITGILIKKLAQPTNVPQWYPTGICCSDDSEEVYVACKKVPSIYRYSLTDEYEYRGVVTKDVKQPWGIALTEDGQLLVVDQYDVKVVKVV